ncbi:MAG TPA: methyltransferase domain-containing protein [Methylomirabilota bacterium]|nr:methyltransferase domain-containing protein [Methylomirabilota bacterium]
MTRYRIRRAGPRSTEQLVEAGGYGYAHSCVTSENFPSRGTAAGPAEIVLVGFDGAATAGEALAEAARRGLARPTYEDALHFGAEHPEAQRGHAIVFLHEPWVGYFGRRDVLCLWSNAGRRELGLEGFDDPYGPDYRFAFVAPPRPFYAEFAWAYDYLVARPVAEECAGMAAALARRGVGPGASLLDAGCGTGRYAVELARRGFVVTGIDRSPELLAEALRRPVEAGARVRFESGDLLTLPGRAGFDAIVCRGVLNDLVEPADRAAAFGAFARALRPGGALLFDVRDWDASVAGKSAQPVSERCVTTPRGPLVFRSVTRVDPATRRLLIEECHRLTTASGEITASYDFAMRCWGRDELDGLLGAEGFEAIEYAGTYEGAPLGVGDRLVVAASLGPR